MAEIPPEFARFQAYRDDEHLKLLGIFHYVVGGMSAFGGFAGLLYVFFGAMMASAASFPTAKRADQLPPAFFADMFFFIGGFIFLIASLFAALNIWAGWCLVRRRNPTLIYLVAALNCLQIPWGTILGVFTFIVMGRNSVKAQFGGAYPLVEPLGNNIPSGPG